MPWLICSSASLKWQLWDFCPVGLPDLSFRANGAQQQCAETSVKVYILNIWLCVALFLFLLYFYLLFAEVFVTDLYYFPPSFLNFSTVILHLKIQHTFAFHESNL